MSEDSSKSVDGLVGFGRGNESILSQLASSGKAKKVFSHCLDAGRGGGIFSIGEVMDPKVNRTPLVPNEYVISTFLFVSFPFRPIYLGRKWSYLSFTYALGISFTFLVVLAIIILC